MLKLKHGNSDSLINKSSGNKHTNLQTSLTTGLVRFFPSLEQNQRVYMKEPK